MIDVLLRCIMLRAGLVSHEQARLDSEHKAFEELKVAHASLKRKTSEETERLTKETQVCMLWLTQPV